MACRACDTLAAPSCTASVAASISNATVGVAAASSLHSCTKRPMTASMRPCSRSSSDS